MRMRFFAPVILVISLVAVSLTVVVITCRSSLAQPTLTLPTLTPPTLPPATLPPTTLTPPAPPAAQAGAKQAAAEECLTTPGAAGPAGSHWYYHIDRATRRQCWYLGTAGAKVVRQTEPRKPASSTLPTAEPVAEQTEQPAAGQPAAQVPVEGASAQPATAQILPNQTFLDRSDPNPSAPAARSAGDAAADQGMSAPDLRRSQGVADPAPASNNYAQEQPATETEDDMPLVWPVLTPAELAAAGLAPSSTVKPAFMLAVLVGALAFAAVIARLLFKLFGTRQADRSVVRDQRRLVQNPSLPRRPVAPARGNPSAQDTFAQRPSAQRPSAQVAAERLVDVLRKPVAAPRLGDIPSYGEITRRPLLQPAQPGGDVEDDLRTLLRNLQRTAA